MENLLDYPEMRKQLIEQLQDIGFDMKDWHINTYHATGEGTVYEIKDKWYESCDYVYLINKNNRKDVFYLWIEIAWTDGMDYPVLYIIYLSAEDVETEIVSFNGNIEDHFTKNYNSVEKTNGDTIRLVKKYSISPLRSPKDIIKERVTPTQYELILKNWASRKKLREIKGLWAKFMKIPYPDEGRIDDLPLLDTTIAGCVSSYISNKGILEPEKKQILIKCLPELQRAIDKLPKDAREHFLKLKNLAELVIENLK